MNKKNRWHRFWSK